MGDGVTNCTFNGINKGKIKILDASMNVIVRNIVLFKEP